MVLSLVADYARVAIVSGSAVSAIAAVREGARFVRSHLGSVVALYLLTGLLFVALLVVYGYVDVYGGSRVDGMAGHCDRPGLHHGAPGDSSDLRRVGSAAVSRTRRPYALAGVDACRIVAARRRPCSRGFDRVSVSATQNEYNRDRVRTNRNRTVCPLSSSIVGAVFHRTRCFVASPRTGSHCAAAYGAMTLPAASRISTRISP